MELTEDMAFLTVWLVCSSLNPKVTLSAEHYQQRSTVLTETTYAHMHTHTHMLQLNVNNAATGAYCVRIRHFY